MVEFAFMLKLPDFEFLSSFRFLGTVDHLGMAYADPVIATGYGSYLASPMLRAAYEENSQMSEEEAIEVLTKAMQVLYYRDARSFPKVCSLLFLLSL